MLWEVHKRATRRKKMKLNWIILVIGIILVVVGLMMFLERTIGWLSSLLSGVAFIVLYYTLKKKHSEK